MKKFASLLMTAALLATMLSVFALPASAADEDKWEELAPNEDNGIDVDTPGNYIIRKSYEVNYFKVNSSSATVTIAKGAAVTVEEGFYNDGTVRVLGTLTTKDYAANSGTVRVSCGGTLVTEKLFYVNAAIYDEHRFDNGVCQNCGITEDEYEAQATELAPDEDNNINVSDHGDYIIRGTYTVSIFHVNSSSATVMIAKGAAVTVEEGFYNDGTVRVLGTLTTKDYAVNSGTVRVSCDGTLVTENLLHVNAAIYNEHRFDNGVCQNCGITEDEAALTKLVPNIDGDIDVSDHGDYIIRGTYMIRNFNVYSSSATVTIAKGAAVTVEEGFYNDGTVHVLGTLTVKQHEDNSGTVHVGCGGTLEGNTGGTVTHDEHRFDNGICQNCGFVDKVTHKHIYQPTAVYHCACGKDAPKGFVPGDSTGSVLSEGNLTIIIAIAALVIGLGGGFLLGKIKKKPALASGTDNTDEE